MPQTQMQVVTTSISEASSWVNERGTKSAGSSKRQKDSRPEGGEAYAGLWNTLTCFLRGQIPAMPLPLVVMCLIGAGQVALGLAHWHSIDGASRESAVSVARDHFRETISKTAKALQTRINTAERLVRIQRSQWEHGVMGDETPSLRQYTFTALLDMTVAYQDSVAAIYYTSRTMGLNGYYVERTLEGKYAFQVWDTDVNGTFFNSAIDPDTGRAFGPASVTPGYNVSEEVWVRAVMPPRVRAPPIWTKPYGWGTTLWLSLSNPIFDPSGNMIAIAGVDFDLTFITTVLQQIIAEQQKRAIQQAFQMVTYLFDASGDTIIGSSIPANVVTTLEFDGTHRTLNVRELGATVDPRLQAVAAFIRSQNSRLGDRQHWSFTIPGYFVDTAVVTSSYSGSNLKWILVQLVEEQSVLSPLETSARASWGAVGATIALSFVLALIGTSGLTLGLWNVQRMLESLAQLNFQSTAQLLHLGRTRTIPFGVKETWELRLAAHRLAESLALDQDNDKETLNEG